MRLPLYLSHNLPKGSWKLQCADDWYTLSQYQYPGMSEEQAKHLIAQWNEKQYNGQYFEQLAIVEENQIVGYVSLFDQSDDFISDGIEIYAPYRRKGFAYGALAVLIHYAKNLGYHTMIAQIRQDNTASLALHNKLGFVITDQFTNKRGNPVYILSLSLR